MRPKLTFFYPKPEEAHQRELTTVISMFFR